MNAVLKLNSVSIKHRLVKEGFTLCKCSEYDGKNWLRFTPDSYYEIHGVNEVTDGDKDFGEDISEFIAFCKLEKMSKK